MSKLRFSGSTREEALRKASETLGMPVERLNYQEISRGGGLLGLLSQKVTVEIHLSSEPLEASDYDDVPEPVVTRPRPQQNSGSPHEDDDDGPQPGNVRDPKDEQPPSGEWMDRANDGNRDPRASRDGGRPGGGQRDGRGFRGDRNDRGDRHDRGPRGDRPRGRPEGAGERSNERPERPARGPEAPREGGRRDDRGFGDRRRDDRWERRPDAGRKPPRARNPEQDSDGGDEEVETRVVDEAVFEEKMAKAQSVLAEIVRLLGSDASVTVSRREAEINISVAGSLPEWVGRGHSRVVESIQFLANKIVNRFPPRYRVVIQVEGQKDQRAKDLEEMAASLMKKVLETGKPVWILPMAAKERRIVHMVVAGNPELASHSVGEGATRRLCISLASAVPVQAEAPVAEAPGPEVSSPEVAEE